MSENETKCSFKVGQLLQSSSEGMLLVLDIKWDSDMNDWRVHFFPQRTGIKEKLWAGSLDILGNQGRLWKAHRATTQQSQEHGQPNDHK